MKIMFVVILAIIVGICIANCHSIKSRNGSDCTQQSK